MFSVDRVETVSYTHLDVYKRQATYVGYTVTGNIWGSLLATFAVSLPSLTIMLLITKFYMKLHNNRYVQDAMYGMLPMVVAMILAATLLLLTPDTFIDWYS